MRVRFLLILTTMVIVYCILFHFLMNLEGKGYSWINGFYRALTVMPALGFFNITFNTDMSKLFSLIVLLSGVIFMPIMLPFTFIQFFYTPCLEAQTKAGHHASFPRIPSTMSS